MATIQIYTMDLDLMDDRQVFWVSEKGEEECFVIYGNDGFPILAGTNISDKALAYLGQKNLIAEHKKRGWKVPVIEKFAISRKPISSGKLADAVEFSWEVNN